MRIEYLNLPSWKVPKKEDIVTLNSNIKIGVIDSAINCNLFDKDQLEEYKNFTSINDETFEFSHSSLVCQIIRDINPRAKIYLAQVYGEGGKAATAPIYRAIEWLIEKKKVNIINMSLGFYKNCKGDCQWEEILQEAKRKYNVIFVVSGGNSEKEHPNYTVSCPGCCKEVITVGGLAKNLAVDSELNLEPLRLPDRVKPDIYANGYIQVTFETGQTEVRSGTSFATPIVTAIISKYYSLIENEHKDFENLAMIFQNLISGFAPSTSTNMTYFLKKIEELRLSAKELSEQEIESDIKYLLNFLDPIFSFNNEQDTSISK